MSKTKSLEQERRGPDDWDVKNYFGAAKRVHDARENIDVVKIFAGDCYVTQEDIMLSTILGSCVSACIRDARAGVGGMNHFLLPGEVGQEIALSDSARYGVYAMESLLNGILSKGGRKDRLEIKVFGGGNVINNSARIGSRNAQFIRGFLQKEGLRTAAHDLEGDYPRRVHYYPASGKLMMRQLKRREDMHVVVEETRYRNVIAAAPVEGDIELF